MRQVGAKRVLSFYFVVFPLGALAALALSPWGPFGSRPFGALVWVSPPLPPCGALWGLAPLASGPCGASLACPVLLFGVNACLLVALAAQASFLAKVLNTSFLFCFVLSEKASSIQSALA